MIHLDTSFLIRALIRDSSQDRQLRAWLRTEETIGMSAVAWSEFLCGPVEPADVEIVAQIVTVRAPFGERDAVVAARLFNDSGRRRGSLTDCMIAAASLGARATLATCNPRDFRPFQAAGLRIAPA